MWIKYPKIQTMFMRGKSKVITPFAWTTPELESLQNNVWTFREKLDGLNIRLAYDGNGQFDLFGRTDEADFAEGFEETIRATYGSPDFIRKVEKQFRNSPVILFGEGLGKGYNGNYGLEHRFVLFDVYLPVAEMKPQAAHQISGWWLERENCLNAAHTLDIDICPLLGTGTLLDAIQQVKRGIQSQYGNFEAEGIVAVPQVPLYTRMGKRVMTKIKTRDFRAHQRSHPDFDWTQYGIMPS